jgi:hypothetical protein
MSSPRWITSAERCTSSRLSIALTVIGKSPNWKERERSARGMAFCALQARLTMKGRNRAQRGSPPV